MQKPYWCAKEGMCCVYLITALGLRGHRWFWIKIEKHCHTYSCCLLLFSYAEVRAERRRAFGLEELSPPEIAPSSVKVIVESFSTYIADSVYKVSLCASCKPDPLVLNAAPCSRLRSCTWTSAPRWTVRGTETVVHVRYPPTAPGSPPTQRCQTLHVSHPSAP